LLRQIPGILGAVVVLTVLCGPASAQDRTARLRSRFQSESDPVARAKLMPQLGESEFQAIRKSVEAGRIQEALSVLRQYRDEAQLCENELDARKTNAEKHPAGFKQLQISLRESLRRLNEISAGLTADDQAAFAPMRNDLDEMNRHLVQELFPREQTPGPPPDKEKH
jgi:hypothetical protein